MNKYLKYIGFKIEKSVPVVLDPYHPTTNTEVAEKYLEYLKELYDYQKERRSTIESKNSQLVGQASIVTSIFSLFVPLLIDKFNDFSLWVSIPLSFAFLYIMAHYLLTIIHSIRTLKINKYRYPTRSTSSLTKADRADTKIDFLNGEISDMIYIVNKSTPIDNDKGQNLIFATRCFEIANIGFGILTVAIILSSFFFKKEDPEIRIKNFNEIQLFAPGKMNDSIVKCEKTEVPILKINANSKKIKGG